MKLLVLYKVGCVGQVELTEEILELNNTSSAFPCIGLFENAHTRAQLSSSLWHWPSVSNGAVEECTNGMNNGAGCLPPLRMGTIVMLAHRWQLKTAGAFLMLHSIGSHVMK